MEDFILTPPFINSGASIGDFSNESRHVSALSEATRTEGWLEKKTSGSKERKLSIDLLRI